MIQEIITGMIVLAAIGIALNKLVKTVRKPDKSCDGCADDCGGCGVMDLKKEIEEKKKEMLTRKP